MGRVVKSGLHGPAAERVIQDFCAENSIEEVAKFTAMTLADLAALHVGAIVGLGITQAQFEAWAAMRS